MTTNTGLDRPMPGPFRLASQCYLEQKVKNDADSDVCGCRTDSAEIEDRDW